jgi:L-amino acid N-acyltransferase YncA
MKRLTVRKCKLKDSKIILKIFNNSVKMGYTETKKKIKFELHHSWLKKKLLSKKDFLFIGKFDNKVIGYIRFDETRLEKYDISIGLKNQFIGKGLGSKFLNNSINKIINIKKIRLIKSKVKKKNINSINFFIKNNFVEIISKKLKIGNYRYFKLNIS